MCVAAAFIKLPLCKSLKNIHTIDSSLPKSFGITTATEIMQLAGRSELQLTPSIFGELPHP